MTPESVLDLFRRSGALLEGHFRLTSGLHSERYLQCALVLQYPDLAEQLGAALADAHPAPAADGRPVAGARRHRHRPGSRAGAEVRALFAERQEGALTLRRGFTLSEADRVLVVEDVLTTGGSTRETAAVAEAQGAQVVGAAVIVDRGADPARLNLPLQALVQLQVPTYQPDECPMCAASIRSSSRAQRLTRATCNVLRARARTCDVRVPCHVPRLASDVGVHVARRTWHVARST